MTHPSPHSGREPASEPGHPDDRRVFVTGLGMVTPLGSTVEQSWQNLVAGASGLGWLPEERIARWQGPGVDWDPRTLAPGLRAGGDALRWLQGSESSGSDNPLEWMTRVAAWEAWADASLDRFPITPARIGCTVGASKGDFSALAPWMMSQQSHHEACRRAGRLFGTPTRAGQIVTETFPVTGPASCPVAACATGLHSVELAASWIRQGIADAVICGSADSSLHPGLMASFHRLGVLARSFGNPEDACRPFDRAHSGFLIGEAAGILVLESGRSVRLREIPVYAEVLQGMLGADCSGITGLDDSGDTIRELMQRVLERNQLEPQDIDLVNVHGTATLPNDLAESRALARLFATCQEQPSCTALKGQFGHLLGAAAAVELGLTLLSLQHQWIPPVKNLVTPAPDCEIPRSSGARPLRKALKISLGFGGHLAVGLLAIPGEPVWRIRQPSAVL